MHVTCNVDYILDDILIGCFIVELRQKLKDAVEQMQREGACFGKDHGIYFELSDF